MTHSDVALLENYWDSLSPEDLQRMHLNPALMLRGEARRARFHALVGEPGAPRSAAALIWESDGRPIGFCTIASLKPGDEGEFHLHMFAAADRRKGWGTQLVVLSLRELARQYALRRIVCQPAADNPHPNGVFRKLGIPIVRTYRLESSGACDPHEVNRYEIDPQSLG